MRRASLALALALVSLVSLGACRERYTNPDFNADAAVPDAGGEGEGEGEACPCEAPLVCDDSAGRCVTCLEAEGEPDPGCALEAPHCQAGSCVACLEDSHCSAPGLFCRQSACEPFCVQDEECQRTGLGIACLEGQCIECATAQDCAPRGCDPVGHVCSGADPGSIDGCQGCVSDLDCGDGRCVVQQFGAETLAQTVCAGTCETDDDCTLRGQSCQDATSRSGEAGRSCLPRTTTCVGYLALDDDCGADPTLCGVVEDGSDAICRGLPGGCFRCSYDCWTTDDCPPGQECPPAGANPDVPRLCSSAGCP